MRDDEKRVCRLCGGDPKPKSEFYSYKHKEKDGSTKEITRTECKECQNVNTRNWHRAHRYRHILNNSRRADRVLGLEHGLTKEVIEGLISQPCRYCEQTDDRMGVDRMDNSVGHTVKNCVPCCIRCNSLKRDMPFAAWQFLAPKIKEAAELGLFGEWLGHTPETGKRGRRLAGKPKLPDRRLRGNRQLG